MIRFIFLIVISLVSIASLSAQTANDWQPNKWREFTLDQTKAEEAIKVLGTPDKDRIDNLPVQGIGNWLSAKQKEKAFRVLVWLRKESRDEVTMSFLDDKLVMVRVGNRINLGRDDMPWVSPDDLDDMFGEKFTSFNRGKLPSVAEFQNFGGEAHEKLKKNSYLMIGIAKTSFISAFVDDIRELEKGVGIFGGTTKKPSAEKRNKERRERNAAQELPGEILVIQIVSRSLEA